MGKGKRGLEKEEAFLKRVRLCRRKIKGVQIERDKDGNKSTEKIYFLL